MGGIDAIGLALSSLTRFTCVPIVVLLHIRPQWAAIVAREAEGAAARPCRLAEDGQKLQAGMIYLAPGDANLIVERRTSGLSLHHRAPEAGRICPSVDVLFVSAAKALRAHALGIVLTGMGEDGLAGARAIVEQGGSVVVQDPASSLVWGMPGAVFEAGLASAMLAPSALGPMLHRSFPSSPEPRPFLSAGR